VAGEKYTVRSFINCTVHQKLYDQPSKGGYDGLDMKQVWEKLDMHMRFAGYLGVLEKNFKMDFKQGVVMSTVIWEITPSSPLKVSRRFGGTYRLHLQGERRCQAELC
jgi:hypothetical protein